MGPVFKQRLLASPGRLFEERARIGAEPGEERQVVRPDEHVDRVDLEQARALQHLAEVAAVRRSARSRVGEALGGERDSTRFGKR